MKENDQQLLFQLPYGELDLASIIKVLEVHNIPLQGKSSKAELSELLRQTLEKTQAPDILIQLRLKEIVAVKHANVKDSIMAKLKSRGLGCAGNKDVLIGRLCDALDKERAQFESHVRAQELRSLRVGGNGTTASAQRIPLSIRSFTTNQKTNEETALNENIVVENERPQETENVLTGEQRDRIERNRKRAFELQAAAQQKRMKLIASPSLSSPATNPSAVKTTEAPILESSQKEDDVATSESKATSAYKSTSALSSPLCPKKINPYLCKVTPSPAKALTRPASLVKVGPVLVPCQKCGDRSGKGLCIVWEHIGNIHRECTSTGRALLRWDCCGRIHPQPCYVGLHQPTVQQKQETSKAVMCSCSKPAHLKRTKKRGSNAGRYFFRCNSTGEGSCDFFRWADKAFGMPKQIPAIGQDGFRDWQYPWANPFGEADLVNSSEKKKRCRLVAALLLRELCAIVDGSLGFTCCLKPLPDVVKKVMDVLQSPEMILSKLMPLRPDQIAHRFSSLAAVQDISEVECEELSVDMLLNSHLVKSIGISAVPQKSPDGAKDVVFVKLNGLEAYLAA